MCFLKNSYDLERNDRFLGSQFQKILSTKIILQSGLEVRCNLFLENQPVGIPTISKTTTKKIEIQVC